MRLALLALDGAAPHVPATSGTTEDVHPGDRVIGGIGLRGVCVSVFFRPRPVPAACGQ